MKMRRFIVIFLALMCFTAQPVYAHWDDDAWVERERRELQDWESKLELDCFLACQEGKPVVVTLALDGSGGKFKDVDCENVALQLRDKAREWGRYLDVEILTPQETRKYYGKSLGYHAINKAVIGNEWWYVDYSENKIWHPLNLD